MKKISLLFIAFTLSLMAFSQQTGDAIFAKYFTGKTMRFDYFHSGTATEEHFSMDRVLNDGPWAGSETVLLDNLNRGLYFYEIIDPKTGTTIYSRGFASVFGEWQTIPDAAANWGTFHESIRFPWPNETVKLVIKKRDAKNNFIEIWNTEIDPSARYVNPAELKSGYKSFTYLENGPAKNHVDIVILGDGYTQAEMGKFQK